MIGKINILQEKYLFIMILSRIFNVHIILFYQPVNKKGKGQKEKGQYER